MNRLFSTLMSVLLVFTLLIPNSVYAEYEESSGTASDTVPPLDESLDENSLEDIEYETVDKTDEKLSEVHIDVHYVHSSNAPIPEFVLAIEDEKGKELGTVTASKVN